MTNYKVVLQYEGTRYDGWQKQGNTDNTIQGKLEQLLSRLEGRPVEVHGSGRTDAGVHALAQTANFMLEQRKDPSELLDQINQYLPEDIRMISVEEAQPRFHSRLNAREKTYMYRIETAPKKNVFERKLIYGLGSALNTADMRTAAGYLAGQHDFFGFSTGKRTKKSTIRTIYELAIEEHGSEVRIVVRGNGFLYNMIRILAGTLIEVGQGARRPESVLKVLETGDRQLAGRTAPPEGLFLVGVGYE